MKKFETLFFDADDTIFDFGKAQRVAFCSTFDTLNYYYDEKIYKLYDQINIKFWKKLERGEVTKEQLAHGRFKELYDEIGMEGDIKKTQELYHSTLGEQTFWLEGAREGIEILHKKYKIYITTNGDEKTQTKRINKSGLYQFIDDMFISGKVGYAKPDKRFYDYCFEHSDAKRETTLVIGDSLTGDMQGGINSNLPTLWCNFKQEQKPANMPIDYIVTSWKELLDFLI